MLNPDEYAWRLFVALNWPADTAKGEPDPTKKLGDPGPVYWETWANAIDVYRTESNSAPSLCSSAAVAPALSGSTRSQREFDPIPLKQTTLGEASVSVSEFDSIVGDGLTATLMNRATLDFICRHNLFTLAGQKALAASGATTLQFPPQAKEVKARWRRLDNSEDKARYYWIEIKGPDGSVETYGLSGLHISTKDLPNWLWITFEHIDNAAIGRKWELKSHDTFACKGKQPDCNEAPKGIGLEGTAWANYRLRGTQIDFTDSRGKPTLLANSQLEATFQTRSSCITCHSKASVDANGDRLVGSPDVGPVQHGWYETNGKSRFTQLDFVWSMFRVDL